jgi:hypothetical protein
LHFANLATGKLIVKGLEVLMYCSPDVFDGFGFGISL